MIHHSDQGSQYAAISFGSRCKRAGVRPSMDRSSRRPNALCESFFATLECELIERARLRTPREAKRVVFEWIEGWYNPRRRHSSVGYLSPAEFERRAAAATPASTDEPGRERAQV